MPQELLGWLWQCPGPELLSPAVGGFLPESVIYLFVFPMPFPLFTDQLSERPCGRSSSLSAATSSQTNPQVAVPSTAPEQHSEEKAVSSIRAPVPEPLRFKNLSSGMNIAHEFPYVVR